LIMNPSIKSPTCEIITIGSELLLGQIEDTNTTYLARELGREGVTILFRTAVADRLDEIEKVLRSAIGRCDMVITTGGLGPTLDDLTREAVSRSADVELEFRQDLMDGIEEMFRLAGYQMPKNNRRQAFVPAGGYVILNPVGTAPAFIKEVKKRPVICLPGVPRELKFLLDKEVIPWVRQRFNLDEHMITYRVLKTVGIGESKVDSLIGDLIKPGQNPEVGLLASMGEIKIRIAAKAKSEQEAHRLIEPVAEEVCSRLGKKIYGRDDETLEGVIDALLAENGLNLGILETFSGGLAAQRFHSLPSSRLIESLVIPDEKQVARYSGNDKDITERETAMDLARKTRGLVNASVGLAITGFLKKDLGGGYTVKGYAAAAGEGIEKGFPWDMGGDLFTLQQRGSVIGLNTLRLALLDVQKGGNKK
ncbi:MAG: CinA family nicotinamide mononucleotide deamidase-related protein, partial [Desulfobacterales bacterium]|nr:CinA family nicotinamide mononucleotide deamidase-related protein [Desulfobacterales bacterium]